MPQIRALGGTHQVEKREPRLPINTRSTARAWWSTRNWVRLGSVKPQRRSLLGRLIHVPSITFLFAIVLQPAVANSRVIYDGVKEWQFSGNSFKPYSREGKIYFRIAYRDGDYLWDPNRERLTSWPSVNGKVTFEKYGPHLLGFSPLKLTPEISVSYQSAPTLDATTFQDFVDVASPDLNGRFLLLGRQRNDYFADRFCCDNRSSPSETLKQRYDEASEVLVYALADDSVLFVVASLNDAQKGTLVYFKLSSIPQTPLSFRRVLYLIPSSVIGDSLDRAGSSLQRRYALIKNYLNAATAVRISSPGEVVNENQFFSDSK